MSTAAIEVDQKQVDADQTPERQAQQIQYLQRQINVLTERWLEADERLKSLEAKQDEQK